ncbi:MAG: hypothetical protein HQL32_00220 [Planctomycetes bacterium]|nr:hypothetical protein [Planctomycetota bacterium]
MIKKGSFIAGALLLSLTLSSCRDKRQHPYDGTVWQPKKVEQVDVSQLPEHEVMSQIKDIAILPFIDRTNELDHNVDIIDLNNTAEAFANHLVGSETFNSVLYPRQALDQLEGTSYNITRQDDLKEIGNLLDVDALVFGVIKQYNMYYPPKLSLSMRFYLTRLDRFATATEISSLAHSGVPLNNYNPTFFRQLWNKSAFYDGSSSIFSQKLNHYLKTHDSQDYGWGKERFLRTKQGFLDVIAYDLASSLDSASKEESKIKPSSFKKGKKGRPMPSGYYHR